MICRGTLLTRWKPVYADNRCDIDLALRANHIQVTNEQRAHTLLTDELVSSNSDLSTDNELNFLIFTYDSATVNTMSIYNTRL